MADTSIEPGPTPGAHDEIDVDDAAQVTAWSQRIGCTEDQLRAAVRSVGASAVGVEAYLQGKNNPRRNRLHS